MGDSKLTTSLSVRVPNELMLLKGKYETPTEFVIRAIKLLRDGKGSDPKEHELLLKIIKEFVKQKVNMKLDKEEIQLVKELWKQC